MRMSIGLGGGCKWSGNGAEKGARNGPSNGTENGTKNVAGYDAVHGTRHGLGILSLIIIKINTFNIILGPDSKMNVNIEQIEKYISFSPISW